jgi:predicted TIM-barrel enzyme
MERLPTEIALTEQTRTFKAIKRRKPITARRG